MPTAMQLFGQKGMATAQEWPLLGTRMARSSALPPATWGRHLQTLPKGGSPRCDLHGDRSTSVQCIRFQPSEEHPCLRCP